MFLWQTGLLIAVLAIMPASIADAADDRTETGDPIKAHVERLIPELDAATRSARTDAERKLKALGSDALPFLPPPDLLPSVSAREAVRRIRHVLERRKAADSVRATHVTLKGRQTLRNILRALIAQTGNPIDFSALPPEVLSTQLPVDLENRSFWSALDEINTNAKLQYPSDSDADHIRLVSTHGDSTDEAAVAYSGPFRISVTNVTKRPFPNRGPFRIVRVNFRVRAEPRLRALFVKYRGSDFFAVSAAGQALPAFSPSARPEIPLGEGGRHLNLQSDFRVAADEVPKELRFRGKLTLTAAAGSERIEFTQLATSAGTSRRRGGVTVKLRKFELGAPVAQRRPARVSVVVSYDIGGPAFESHRTWIFHNQVYLQRKDGSRIERDGVFHTNLQTDGAVAVEYGFRDLQDGLQDLRFVYVAPTLLVDLPITLDFPKLQVSPTANERKQP